MYWVFRRPISALSLHYQSEKLVSKFASQMGQLVLLRRDSHAGAVRVRIGGAVQVDSSRPIA
jgi:hypothetical protein